MIIHLFKKILSKSLYQSPLKHTTNFIVLFIQSFHKIINLIHIKTPTIDWPSHQTPNSIDFFFWKARPFSGPILRASDRAPPSTPLLRGCVFQRNEKWKYRTPGIRCSLLGWKEDSRTSDVDRVRRAFRVMGRKQQSETFSAFHIVLCICCFVCVAQDEMDVRGLYGRNVGVCVFDGHRVRFLSALSRVEWLISIVVIVYGF